MDIFLLLFTNLIPFYALIALGWVAGRYFDVDRQSLGALGIYIIMPVVAFGFITKIELSPAYIALPFIVYGILNISTFFWFVIGKRVFKGKRANLLAMTGSSANTGYMGLPIILSLFESNWVAVYIFMMMGGVLHEATTMYYIAARSQFSVKQSMMKLVKFPALYAVAMGLTVNAMGFNVSALAAKYITYFNGAYVVIGMMIIGAALSQVTKLVIAPKFLSLSFLAQFALWPLMAGAVVLFDLNISQIFEPTVHQLLMVMSLMPTAANVAAFAIKLDLDPEQAATTVLLSTIFALLYIPAMLLLLGIY